jgi:hypothetical protein
MSRMKVKVESTPILFLSSINMSCGPTKNGFDALKINYVVKVFAKGGLILSDTFPHSEGFKILGKV